MAHNDNNPILHRPHAVQACTGPHTPRVAVWGEPGYGRAYAAKLEAAKQVRRTWVTWDGPLAATLTAPIPPALLRSTSGDD